MELATIIQAICSNDDEVMALLLNDPAFDRQHLADLNGVVVMGITFNSSMMMLHKESDVAGRSDCSYLHVMLRLLYAEVARIRPDTSFQNLRTSWLRAMRPLASRSPLRVSAARWNGCWNCVPAAGM